MTTVRVVAPCEVEDVLLAAEVSLGRPRPHPSEKPTGYIRSA